MASNLFLFIPSVLISIAIIVPLTGVLVRYRANYNPKGLQLDNEGGAQAHTGPVITSYFAMMGRVYRLEGWPGLYKGLMPTLLSTFVVSSFILAFLDSPKPRHGAYRAPEGGVIGLFFYSVGTMLVGLPTAILTYRAITTPHRLPYFQPMKSLRVLLTPTERQKPWMLYLAPGLLASEVAHIALVLLFLTPLRAALLPRYVPISEDADSILEVSWWKTAIYLVFATLVTLVLTPLEVMGTRLAIQRNHASSDYNSVTQEVEGDAEDLVEYAGADEDVIGLRSEEDPYVGLVDCAKRIIDEEGWTSLYRAWWLTLLGALASSVA